MQMPSTPWSIMQSSTRRCPSRSRSPEGLKGVGAIGNTPVHRGDTGAGTSTSRVGSADFVGTPSDDAARSPELPAAQAGLSSSYCPPKVLAGIGGGDVVQ